MNYLYQCTVQKPAAVVWVFEWLHMARVTCTSIRKSLIYSSLEHYMLPPSWNLLPGNVLPVSARRHEITLCSCNSCMAPQQKNPGAKPTCLQSRPVTYWKHLVHYDMKEHEKRSRTVEQLSSNNRKKTNKNGKRFCFQKSNWSPQIQNVVKRSAAASLLNYCISFFLLFFSTSLSSPGLSVWGFSN